MNTIEGYLAEPIATLETGQPDYDKAATASGEIDALEDDKAVLSNKDKSSKLQPAVKSSSKTKGSIKGLKGSARSIKLGKLKTGVKSASETPSPS